MHWVVWLILITSAHLRGAQALEYPNVTLPWGTYRATYYDKDGDFWIFRNIRFGKAPIGKLRFQKSVFPDAVADPYRVRPDEGTSCYSVEPVAPPGQAAAANSTFTIAGQSRLFPGIPRSPAGKPSEDCLFADLYVPASAIAGRKVPIVVWLYGGAFIFGAKDAGFGDNMPFYDGIGLLRAAHMQNQTFVFLTGNYRLGAFGWLAGPTMERHGTPNAGLWDQRLLLDFAKQYVPLFGGNGSDIGVWGESAGGGSILHHLTSTEPPVFNKALVQSPAYLWQWDRTDQGHAARVFHNLTTKANCPPIGDQSISCLQSLNDTILQQLNRDIITEQLANVGLIPFNPFVDGSLITQLPTTAFEQGSVWTNVTSLVVSHVSDESKSFVPHYIKDEHTFQLFLKYFLPGDEYNSQRQAISKQYGNVSDPKQRAQNVIGDSSFLCNTRFVYDAYNTSSSVYMMQYDFLANLGIAVHASDLIPTFLNTDVLEADFYDFMHTINPNVSKPLLGRFFHAVKSLAKEYQPYLASFGATGSPTPSQGFLNWTVAQSGDELINVMEVSWSPLGYYFGNKSTDKQNTNSTCHFWYEIARSLEAVATNRRSEVCDHQTIVKLEL